MQKKRLEKKGSRENKRTLFCQYQDQPLATRRRAGTWQITSTASADAAVQDAKKAKTLPTCHIFRLSSPERRTQDV